jgi:hypothetical protein
VTNAGWYIWSFMYTYWCFAYSCIPFEFFFIYVIIFLNLFLTFYFNKIDVENNYFVESYFFANDSKGPNFFLVALKIRILEYFKQWRVFGRYSGSKLDYICNKQLFPMNSQVVYNFAKSYPFPGKLNRSVICICKQWF